MGGGGEIDAHKIEYNDKMTTNERINHRTNSNRWRSRREKNDKRQYRKKSPTSRTHWKGKTLSIMKFCRSKCWFLPISIGFHSERNKMDGNVMELCLLSLKCPYILLQNIPHRLVGGGNGKQETKEENFADSRLRRYGNGLFFLFFWFVFAKNLTHFA